MESKSFNRSLIIHRSTLQIFYIEAFPDSALVHIIIMHILYPFTNGDVYHADKDEKTTPSIIEVAASEKRALAAVPQPAARSALHN